MPGNYYDERQNFFEQIIHKTMRNRASYYSIRWMNMLRGVDPFTQQQNDPLHQPAPIVGIPPWYFGSFYLDQGQPQATNITQFDLIRMNNLVHGTGIIPNNSAANPPNLDPRMWSACVSNFNSSPYAYLRAVYSLPNNPLDVDNNRTGVRSDYSSIGESFKWGLSPYLGSSLAMPSNPHVPSLGRFTCDGTVNRPFRFLRSMPAYINDQLAGGGFGALVHAAGNWQLDRIRIAHDPYNYLVACPLQTFLYTCLIANQMGTNGAHAAIQNQASNILPNNWNALSAAAANNLPAMNGFEHDDFFGNVDYEIVVGQTQVRIEINLPKPTHAELFRQTNAGTQAFQFGPDNWALNYWRRHYNGWIRRSLYSFGEDDTFVKAFDHARGAANNYEPEAYHALNKVDHTHGGYRLYSAPMNMEYRAPLVVEDANAVAQAAQAPHFPYAAAAAVTLARNFTWLMDHTLMDDDMQTPNNVPIHTLLLHFSARFNKLKELAPPPIMGIVLAGYANTAAYTEIVPTRAMDLNIVNDFHQNPTDTYTPDMHTPAGGQTAQTAGPVGVALQTPPFVQTSTVEGNHILRQDEMGNYFVLTVNNNVADCHIQRVRLAAGLGAADALVFSDHFWEFEDDRVMYLMFNNYGYSFSNANQLVDGGVDGGQG